jgi:hypothetical protein
MIFGMCLKRLLLKCYAVPGENTIAGVGVFYKLKSRMTDVRRLLTDVSRACSAIGHLTCAILIYNRLIGQRCKPVANATGIRAINVGEQQGYNFLLWVGPVRGGEGASPGECSF